jgi:hypothetical protein
VTTSSRGYTLALVPGKGRPPLDHDRKLGVDIHLRLTARHYDELYARAKHARVSVPELIRRSALRREPPGRDDPKP